jgi:IS1 family transposase/DNA-directed RNA polymerase subunit RPC12/RpoP
VLLALLIVKLSKAERCPYCLSAKVVCNGTKSRGAQNYLCKQCGKQFQKDYLYWGADKRVKDKVLPMLLRGSGVRDCAVVLGISVNCVLRQLVKEAGQVLIKPKQSRYHKVQIDELWSYVWRKEKKVWLLYAYCADSGEILGFTMGKRSIKTVKNLMVKLKHLEVGFYCTDDWEAFSAVLPYYQHLIGKQFTRAIEGINTWFRTRVRRLVRRTVCFSKKVYSHYAMIKLVIYHRNNPLSYI